MTIIGKVVATEKAPSSVDEFYFWTDKELVIKPFDVIKADHINESVTFGVVEGIFHLTDSVSSLAGFISSDFGDVNYSGNSERIGMNYVKARVIKNSKEIYTPVLDGKRVYLANEQEIIAALGLEPDPPLAGYVPLPGGYLEMYEGKNKLRIPVNFDSRFLVGPEGAHLNISGISGLASKTSYASFLLKGIQNEFTKNAESHEDSVAFVIFNVKGRDLLAIHEANERLTADEKKTYQSMGIEPTPFQNVRYFYPKDVERTESLRKGMFRDQKKIKKSSIYKYLYEDSKDSLEFLFAHIDDPTQTMDSIMTYISTGQGDFKGVRNWTDFTETLNKQLEKGGGTKNQEIVIASWRKFVRHFKRIHTRTDLFANSKLEGEVELNEEIANIKENDVFVVDIGELDSEIQGFVFGDVIRAVYDLKSGQTEKRDSKSGEIPKKIIIFLDELNKYASDDVPKNSPILRQLLEVTERGRSLGIILFSAEQFRSSIHPRVTGNCAAHAYGRTNAIEISKKDYQFIPTVFKSMLVRLQQGEYLIQYPVFTSVLSIKFPRPVYKQFPNG